MARSRLKIVARLLLLLGLPVSVVLALFGSGVYFGVENRHAVASFEHEWLGLDVEVPPKPPAPAAEDDGSAPPPPQEPATPVAQPAAAPPVAPAPAPAGQPPQSVTPTPTPAAPAPQPGAPVAAPAATPAPLPDALAKRLQLPVTVRLKVLVDPELIVAQPAWIDYAQRTVSQVSQIYQAQFGIHVELVSVGRWMVATAGMEAGQLLADVQQRPREGADVLVGLTNRPLDGRIAGQSEQPVATSAFNGAYAVVYATPGHPDPHLRTLLHELGHMFGAQDVTDAEHPDFKAGSWMSYAPVAPGQAPWIDTANRQRVLERKDKPFAPEGAVPQAEPAKDGD